MASPRHPRRQHFYVICSPISQSAVNKDFIHSFTRSLIYFSHSFNYAFWIGSTPKLYYNVTFPHSPFCHNRCTLYSPHAVGSQSFELFYKKIFRISLQKCFFFRANLDLMYEWVCFAMQIVSIDLIVSDLLCDIIFSHFLLHTLAWLCF